MYEILNGIEQIVQLLESTAERLNLCLEFFPCFACNQQVLIAKA